ncbi:MAG: rhodanese-like domain-containing protein [Elusimicrobia bacterium]|nr:rhodanese-like domain-containing protein [Elusimicrobiota bacterium]
MVKEISAQDFVKLDKSKITIVDMREEKEYIGNSFEKSINLPISKFWVGVDNIPKDKPVYVFCESGYFSEEMVILLEERGYDATNILGGWEKIKSCF